MTIRTRLTAWYAGILFLSLLVTCSLLYHEVVPHAKSGRDSAKFIERDEEEHRDGYENENRELAGFIFWGTVPSALLAIAGGWWLMRRSLSPIAKLTVTAEKIHEENLAQRLPRSGNGDELDHLAEVFNAMIARLDGSFQRIREFTLNASHELKTPLTILHGEIEAAQRDASLPATLRDKLGSQLDEIQRLSIIVDNLTLLTKADAGQVVLNEEIIMFDEIVREVFEETNILAEGANISVLLKNCEPMPLRGDRRRLRQLLLNLAENAVKYNQPGGTVEFSLRRCAAEVELKIANTGKGVTLEALPRVFERFFRGDATASVDGCGLGLSIVQWIATAHRGTVKIESVPDLLTTVTVRLPLGG